MESEVTGTAAVEAHPLAPCASAAPSQELARLLYIVQPGVANPGVGA